MIEKNYSVNSAIREAFELFESMMMISHLRGIVTYGFGAYLELYVQYGIGIDELNKIDDFYGGNVRVCVEDEEYIKLCITNKKRWDKEGGCDGN